MAKRAKQKQMPAWARRPATIKVRGGDGEVYEVKSEPFWREVRRRQKIASELPPDHQAAKAWKIVPKLGPRVLVESGAFRWLPEPPEKVRGAPKGPQRETVARFDEMTKRIAAGSKPTHAARQTLKSRRGGREPTKGQVDNLVRLFKKSAR